MTVSSPTSEPRESTESAAADSARRFVLWAAERLGLEVGHDGQGRYWLDVPPESRAELDGAARIDFTFDREYYAASKDADLELAAPGSRLLGWLTQRVRQLGNVAHAAPADQPSTVHEISARLFPAYQLDGGTAHLAGCSLDDRLVLRSTWRLRLEGLEPRDELIDIHLGDDGEELTAEQCQALGLDSLMSLERPPRLAPAQLEWLVEASQQAAEARRQQAIQRAAEELKPRREEEQRQLVDYFSKTRAEVAAQLSGEDVTPEDRAGIKEQLASLEEQLQRRLAGVEERYSVQGQIELVAATLIWCKRASGKLRFRFGNQTAELPFDDWARTLKAPPFTCPHTGTASMHLATTDDHRISVAEEVEACQQSGTRVLRKELVRCSVTGKRVLPQFTTVCPITEEPVLTDVLVRCPECHQACSPRAMQNERCRACQSRQSVKASDARLARIFSEHPPLERWRHWSLAETRSVYNLAASGLFKRLLVVLDKESLAVLHVATGSRFSSSWNVVDVSQFEQAIS